MLKTITTLLLAAYVVRAAYDNRPDINNFNRPTKRPSKFPPLVRDSRINSGPQIAILHQDHIMDSDGGYQYAYETQNGITAQEVATVRQVSKDEVAKSAKGSFSWTSPEGELVSISYVADENGYRPQGSHLPTPPPIPEAIERALQYILSLPAHQRQGEETSEKPRRGY